MTNKGLLLHNDALFEFKKQYYGNLLRHEHLISKNKTHIYKLRLPAVEDTIDTDIWAYELEKDGVAYLIEADNPETNEKINIDEFLPVEINDPQDISKTNGDVFTLVRRPVPRRLTPEKKLTVKELIDNLCALEHSNPNHVKLLMFMALSQLWTRSYYRVSSPKGCGKDSIIDRCATLFGECGMIESPSVPKLEDRATVLRLLGVNEVVDINKSQWSDIQQFLLTTGAHKNEVTKRTKKHGIVGEIIDVSRFSMSLFYNDIDHYPDGKGSLSPYFDEVTKEQVRDRFPAFRIYGKYTQDFNEIDNYNVAELVKNNIDFYTDIVKSFLYYKENMNSYYHGYSKQKLMVFESRDKTNMNRLIKVIDMYCESQEEFDTWMDIINKSMIDYVEMLSFRSYYNRFVEKFGYATEAFNDFYEKIRRCDTYIEKKSKINELINSSDKPKGFQDKQIWDDGDINKVEEDIL